MVNVLNKLRDELAGMDSYIALMLVDMKGYQRASIDALKYFSIEEGIPGVYISINRPYSSLKSILLREKIDVETMIFIDAITKVSGGTLEKDENCLYLDGPENLTDFSISINEAVAALSFKDKFLFFDSINTLLIYNDAVAVSRFFHFVTSRIRQWGVKGLIIALDKKTDKAIISQIGQFCDKVIDMGGG